MKARVKWIEDGRFLGISDSGHSLVMEGSASGNSTAPSPMELLLLGMGGCSSYDVVAILKKMRLDVDDVSVELTAERADEVPKVFTKIHAAFTVVGTNIPQAKAEEAVRLSGEKYCSASRMLESTVDISFETKVIDKQ